MLTECVGSEGTEQGSEGAEDDVGQGASGQYVREGAELWAETLACVIWM